MSKFSEVVMKIREYEPVSVEEKMEACMDDGNYNTKKFEFLSDEIFRPAFIRDVYAGSKEDQIAADKEKDEENAANGYDEMGNVIAPEIPLEWM
jgi:hypothetical protein